MAEGSPRWAGASPSERAECYRLFTGCSAQREKGNVGHIQIPQLSSSVGFPPAPQGGTGGTVGEPKGAPLTRREADIPEGCLPEALMGTPVLTAVALSGHLCELFLDTLEQMSCRLRAHGEWSDCFTGSLGEPTLSCLIVSALFLLAFLPQLQWEEEAPHTCLIPSRPWLSCLTSLS